MKPIHTIATLVVLAGVSLGIAAAPKVPAQPASLKSEKSSVGPLDWAQWGGSSVRNNTPDGKFLWQDSSEKLPTGRVHDWPMQGICATPLVEGDRLWFVTSRGEVVCLDTEGFYDGENDGPFTGEKNNNKDEADAVWYFDMM